MTKFIRINVDLAGYKLGTMWEYDSAPDVVKKWLENKDVSLGTLICSLVTEDGKPFSAEPIKIETSKSNPLGHLPNEATRKLYSVCKGVKIDGTPCGSRMLVEGTQYCRHHLHQAQSD